MTLVPDTRQVASDERGDGVERTPVALTHHISVGHLSTVLAANDISLGDWIRSRRLEGYPLARPSSPEHAMTAHRRSTP